MFRSPSAVLLLAVLSTTAQAEAAGDAEPPKRFEGAIGLMSTYGQEYPGAEKSGWGFRPAGFLRYGRITLSGAGGFTTRRDDEVERGLAAELVNRKDWRVNLSGRLSNGRRESASAALAGMGDIESTILARLRIQWTPPGGWKYTLAFSSDVLGHGSGWIADLGASRTWALGPDTKLVYGVDLSFGSDTYMQTWYGVTPEQSQRTGHPVYTPGNSLRDISTGLTLRHEFGKRWGAFVGGRVGRQLGDAAASPLVRRVHGWEAAGGLVWRF